MSLIFFAKSSAYSWKMSFDGQVLCQRMLTGPVCASTFGAATVAAAPAAATVRKRRRLVLFSSVRFTILVSLVSRVSNPLKGSVVDLGAKTTLGHNFGKRKISAHNLLEYFKGAHRAD